MHTISYTYDPVGNRLTKNDNGVITEYSYDDNDRLLTENGYTYMYDNNGNMLSKECHSPVFTRAGSAKAGTAAANK